MPSAMQNIDAGKEDFLLASILPPLLRSPECESQLSPAQASRCRLSQAASSAGHLRMPPGKAEIAGRQQSLPALQVDNNPKKL
jgi:hypothetical protein